MTQPLGIALIGCGTVGGGVVKLLLEQSRRLAERAARPLELRRIIVRDTSKTRPGVPARLLSSDLNSVYADPDVHVAAELMGGVEPARTIILKLLESGKDVVTANKAVLAKHGSEIFAAAHRHEKTVAFEASVGGGIPIIAALSQGLAANEIQSIKAILNGTSNFILTQMTEKGKSYAEALAEAQRLGYAEADPTLDVDGTDSAHKLSVLARVAFGVEVAPEAIERRGIQEVQPADIRFAAELGGLGGLGGRGEAGYIIKLLAEAWSSDHQVALHVEPTLVRRLDLLAQVRGAYNAVHVVGDAVGDTLYYGPGAGQMPTASAVVADIIDLAVGRAAQTFRTLRLWESRPQMRLRDAAGIRSRFYLRINAADRPGVLAEVAGVLGRHRISIASVVQHEALEEHEGDAVPVVIMTHSATIGAFRQAVAIIDRLDCITSPSVYYPVAD